jgi:hypothetical protein
MNPLPENDLISTAQINLDEGGKLAVSDNILESNRHPLTLLEDLRKSLKHQYSVLGMIKKVINDFESNIKQSDAAKFHDALLSYIESRLVHAEDGVVNALLLNHGEETTQMYRRMVFDTLEDKARVIAHNLLFFTEGNRKFCTLTGPTSAIQFLIGQEALVKLPAEETPQVDSIYNLDSLATEATHAPDLDQVFITTPEEPRRKRRTQADKYRAGEPYSSPGIFSSGNSGNDALNQNNLLPKINELDDTPLDIKQSKRFGSEIRLSEIEPSESDEERRSRRAAQLLEPEDDHVEQNKQ